MTIKSVFATALILTTLGAAAMAAPVIQTGDSAKGKILTDSEGMSLYTFDNDKPGVSNCYDDCAAKWPPLFASDTSRPDGDFSIVLRADGKRQWAYKGQPLYAWFQDQQAGDITGDGVKGVWHLAPPVI